jgi:hypothetical protein
VFENRVLRRIFGPKRDEVMGECKKLHSGELHNFYSSPVIITQIKSRKMRWAGYVACMVRGEKCTGLWWDGPKERDHLEDQGVDGEDGIGMDVMEIGWGAVEWIHIAQDRDRWQAVVNAVRNLWVLAPRR